MTLGIAVWFLVDPNWYPKRPRHVRGKGALWVYLFFLIISLPVWMRVPIVITTLSEFIIYRIAMLVWMLDKRPDFAIGPQGIYGIDYLKYRHISWHMMDHLEIRTIVGKHSGKSPPSITFVGKKWDKNSPEKMAKITAPKITLRPFEGVNDQEILALAQKFHPALTINRIEVKPE